MSNSNTETWGYWEHRDWSKPYGGFRVFFEKAEQRDFGNFFNYMPADACQAQGGQVAPATRVRSMGFRLCAAKET